MTTLCIECGETACSHVTKALNDLRAECERLRGERDAHPDGPATTGAPPLTFCLHGWPPRTACLDCTNETADLRSEVAALTRRAEEAERTARIYKALLDGPVEASAAAHYRRTGDDPVSYAGFCRERKRADRAESRCRALSEALRGVHRGLAAAATTFAHSTALPQMKATPGGRFLDAVLAVAESALVASRALASHGAQEGDKP